MEYQLKRLQYSKIYRVNERTIRRWQEKEMPLDEPAQLLQLLDEQKNKPRSLQYIPAGDIYAHWLAESDPEAMRLDVQRELAFRISDAGILLQQARDLARARRDDWPELTSRLNAIRDHTCELLELIGVDEATFDWDEMWRPKHLEAEGLIHAWGNDPDRRLSQSKRLVWQDDATAAAEIVPFPVPTAVAPKPKQARG